MTTYTPSGYGAIALGALCSAGTAAYLLRDIQHTGLTLDHALAIIVLIVTIGAGVMATNALKSWHLVEGGVLVLIAALGGYYCLSSAAGRSAEAQQTSTLTAQSHNGGRERAQAAYDQAVADLATAKAKLQAERDAKRCSICKREKLAVDDAQKAVDAADVRLQAAPAPVPVNVKNTNLAALATLFPAVTVEQGTIVKALNLIDPNVVAFILEVGDIAFWHIGLARLAARRRRRLEAKALAPVVIAEAPALPPPPAPPADRADVDDRDELPAHRKQREARAKVVSFVAAYRREHGREPEPREVRAATGLPRATAWRYQRAAV